MPMPMINYPQSTPQQVNPMAGAVQTALGSYSNAVKAKYMPQQQQSEIFAKQFTPLAQIASNPVAMAMMGDQGQGVMQLIQKLLQQTGAGAGGQNPAGGLTQAGMGGGGGAQNGPPQMAQGGGGGGVAQPQGQSQIPRSQTSADNAYEYDANGNNVIGDPSAAGREATGGQTVRNLPQGNLGNSIVQKKTGEYDEPIHKETYRDKNTGDIIDPLTSSQREATQKILTAIPAVQPIIKKLAAESKEVLADGRAFKLLGSIAANATDSTGATNFSEMEKNGVTPEFLKRLGISPAYYGKWIQFKKDQEDASARLNTINKYGENMPGEHIALGQVQPAMFENYDSYSNRMQTELKKLDYQYKLNKQLNTGGINETPGAQMEAPEYPFGKQQGASQVDPDVKQFLSYHYKNKDDFNFAFDSKSPEIKAKIIQQMQAMGMH